LKNELPKFPPKPPAKAFIKPLLLGKYLVAFLIAAVIEIANPIPKKNVIKKSNIKFVETVNKKSPKAIENAPKIITNLGPK
jgi:hypothetical protein